MKHIYDHVHEKVFCHERQREIIYSRNEHCKFACLYEIILQTIEYFWLLLLFELVYAPQVDVINHSNFIFLKSFKFPCLALHNYTSTSFDGEQERDWYYLKHTEIFQAEGSNKWSSSKNKMGVGLLVAKTRIRDETPSGNYCGCKQ